MQFWLKNIRKITLILALAVSILIYAHYSNIPIQDLKNIKLNEAYGFASLILLYISLLLSPLYKTFPLLPFKAILLHARRAIGVSAFYFAWLHLYFAFFKLLGGFSGLGFLDHRYQIALLYGLIGVLIMTAMAATSFDLMVRVLGKYWKYLHRLIYAGAILILLHVVLLGSHYLNLATPIAQITLFAVLLLLLLEAIRFDRYVTSKFPATKKFSWVFALIFGAIAIGLYAYLNPNSSQNASTFNIHAAHLKQAAQNSANPPVNRYNLSLQTTGALLPGKPVQLTFKVYDADTGSPITEFTPVLDKLAHLVIVDGELQYFAHLHPELQPDGTFMVSAIFPKADVYHLYLNYMPAGGQEQQVGQTLQIGSAAARPANTPPDKTFTKTFGAYQVTLKDVNLNAASISSGSQTITFEIKDSSGNPVTNLKPYLGSFGHLVMINEKTYQYIHVHPASQPNAPFGGPEVAFLPLGLYKPIEPGTYRLFAQFDINDQILVADFTVNVQ